jgi:hypothetical protein
MARKLPAMRRSAGLLGLATTLVLAAAAGWAVAKDGSALVPVLVGVGVVVFVVVALWRRGDRGAIGVAIDTVVKLVSSLFR